GLWEETGETSGTFEPEMPRMGGSDSEAGAEPPETAAPETEAETPEASELDEFGWPAGAIEAASGTELDEEEYGALKEYLGQYSLGNSAGVILASSQGETALSELAAGLCDAALVQICKPFLEDME